MQENIGAGITRNNVNVDEELGTINILCADRALRYTDAQMPEDSLIILLQGITRVIVSGFILWIRSSCCFAMIPGG